MTDKPVPTMRELIDIVETHNENVELEEGEVEDGQVRLKLVPSEEEAKEDWGQPGYQQFRAEVAAAGVEIAAINSISMESAESISVLSGVFDLPLAHDALKILGAALLAWVHGRGGRRVEVSGFGVKLKANSAEDAERLLEKLATLKDSQPAPKKSRKKDHG
ncbi:hypothetical protein [Paraburkholderia terricola]|uniref:hypothetical protein n=1 Tax=Paraburkholderia terricola TaxID=169427 RepID=UPI00285861CA|nr:hypothetical protein [Paraburkholderia terricola]MDR6482861.1 hypothetical protein [Paraburkholderia terricola]